MKDAFRFLFKPYFFSHNNNREILIFTEKRAIRSKLPTVLTFQIARHLWHGLVEQLGKSQMNFTDATVLATHSEPKKPMAVDVDDSWVD